MIYVVTRVTTHYIYVEADSDDDAVERATDGQGAMYQVDQFITDVTPIRGGDDGTCA